jgi:hypothetical protein
MPTLMKADAVRLFEAAVESLSLAISGLASPPRLGLRRPESQFSAHIGLIGSASEMAMSACIAQAFGPTALMQPSGHFLVGHMVREKFLKLVEAGSANSSFLFQGIADAAAHRNSLIAFTQRATRLISSRAGGLHAGRGLLHEATASIANDVADFLDVLALSSRVRPYLTNIPRVPLYTRERQVYVEDLRRRLGDAPSAQAVASLYLVLPDVPGEKPEWVDALGRVSIAPKDRDVVYLLSALQTALPATLVRVGGNGEALAVRVEQDNPHALPISPNFLRRNAQTIADQWYADIGTANARLAKGVLDLPPAEAIREGFAIGLDAAGLPKGAAAFTPHEAWPFVAAAFRAQGTPGPYWFVVRRTGDIAALAGQLKIAHDKAKPRHLKDGIQECLHGIELIRKEEAIGSNDAVFRAVIDDVARAEEQWDKLMKTVSANLKTYPISEQASSRLNDILSNGTSVGDVVGELLTDENTAVAARRYWLSRLCEIANDHDDVAPIVGVLNAPDLEVAHTAAKKALRRIDFAQNGPPIVSSAGAPPPSPKRKSKRRP